MNIAKYLKLPRAAQEGYALASGGASGTIRPTGMVQPRPFHLYPFVGPRSRKLKLPHPIAVGNAVRNRVDGIPGNLRNPGVGVPTITGRL